VPRPLPAPAPPQAMEVEQIKTSYAESVLSRVGGWIGRAQLSVCAAGRVEWAQ